MTKIIFAIGFGGSGKSTYINALYKKFEKKSCYLINLDPAVEGTANKVPWNVDIRDTLDYKSRMESMTLGPNGAISVCLGLFATKMNQLVDILVEKGHQYDYILVDVPGQIEVFTWSASGELILKYFKSTGFPVEIHYILDAIKCLEYKSFVSSTLYALNTYYKLQTPMKLVFNKCENEMFIETVKKYLVNDLDTYEFVQQECEKDYYNNLLSDIQETILPNLDVFDPIFISAKENIGMNQVV